MISVLISTRIQSIPIVYYDKAIALDTLERYDEAANSYQIFLKAEPDDSEVLYYLSEVYLKLNRKIEAISCYNRMLEIDPDDENAKDPKIAAMNPQKNR